MKYFNDVIYGERLKISEAADLTELADNIRCLRSLLSTFPDMYAEIRPHILAPGVKNPEYLINGHLADRKGIKGEKGIAASFNKAIKQGCSVVVLDLDAHEIRFNRIKMAQKILWRQLDFENHVITCCYVVRNGKAAEITATIVMQGREAIIQEINKLGL